MFVLIIYSCAAEGRLSIYFSYLFGCPALRWASLPFSASVKRQKVGWHHRLVGVDAMSQISVCFPSLLSCSPIIPDLSKCPSFTSLILVFFPVLLSLPSIQLSLSLMNISHRKAIYRYDIVPVLHPSSSAFSSVHFLSVLIILRLSFMSFSIIINLWNSKCFFFQSLMCDGRFTLVCHRSTFINRFVTEEYEEFMILYNTIYYCVHNRLNIFQFHWMMGMQRMSIIRNMVPTLADRHFKFGGHEQRKLGTTAGCIWGLLHALLLEQGGSENSKHHSWVLRSYCQAYTEPPSEDEHVLLDLLYRDVV